MAEKHARNDEAVARIFQAIKIFYALQNKFCFFLDKFSYPLLQLNCAVQQRGT